MDIKNQILNALGLSEEKINLEFQAKLEDGTIVVSSADTLESGVDISILTEDGSTIPLPVGDYALEDGTTFTVTEEGKIGEMTTETEAEEEEEGEEVEAKEEDKKKYEETEVKDVITDEVAQATDEIATAIDEATGEEVTPEVAEAAAEIAVAIVEEKIEEVAMNKQLKELTEVLKTELSSLKDRLAEVENTPAADSPKLNKFSTDTYFEELSPAEYNKLPARSRFFYNLEKRRNK
tara:strand:- start:4084 stop:4791 length:708 start_codon:yes stop_codon:yes gene_type:complete